MSKPFAAIVGGAVAVLAVVAILIFLGWRFFNSWCKKLSNKNSDTGSSDLYAQGDWNRGGASSSAPGRPPFGTPGTRQFTMEELEHATKQFSDSNLIGYGSFGPVYKGLLHDSVLAIKTRRGPPRADFVAEVCYLSELGHRNLVDLLGYCQENGSHMLVFEYVSNGSLCNHLYDTGLDSSTKLEFKQRLSIAIGAAKGLCHLHGLNPPLVHKNFKTANVLVDENFIVKVADAGISKLLERIDEGGPSTKPGVDVFRDPEAAAEVSETFTVMSDVYSYGVFLLELITGQQALHIQALGSDQSLIRWVASQLNSNNFVDHRLDGNFTTDGIRDLIRLTLQCMSFRGRARPKMEMVVVELERISDKEMELTTVMGEGTQTFMKGSELFTSK